jgi:SAM-dependent methyltransferase
MLSRIAARTVVSALILSLAVTGMALAQAPAPKPARTPDVIFVPTPPDVVKGMLELAKVSKTDLVYDLGCGDGGIVVAAARDFGARGIGVDIDPVRIKEANENVAKNKVGDKVKIIQADLFEFDVKPATVVTLYLLPSLNDKLRPILWRDLKVGTRVVSNSFAMTDWTPDKTIDVDGRTVYLWTIKPEHKTAK